MIGAGRLVERAAIARGSRAGRPAGRRRAVSAAAARRVTPPPPSAGGPQRSRGGRTTRRRSRRPGHRAARASPASAPGVRRLPDRSAARAAGRCPAGLTRHIIRPDEAAGGAGRSRTFLLRRAAGTPPRSTRDILDSGTNGQDDDVPRPAHADAEIDADAAGVAADARRPWRAAAGAPHPGHPARGASAPPDPRPGTGHASARPAPPGPIPATPPRDPHPAAGGVPSRVYAGPKTAPAGHARRPLQSPSGRSPPPSIPHPASSSRHAFCEHSLAIQCPRTL